MLLPFLFVFYWILDAGKNTFFTFFFGLPSLFLLATVLLFFKRRKNIVFTTLFYMSLVGLTVSSIILISILSTKGTYYPAIGPKDGITAYIIDYPHKGLDNIYKAISVQWEGKGEKYEIQGWLNDDVLIYKKWSSWGYQSTDAVSSNEYTRGRELIQQYNLTTRTSSSFSGKTENLESKTCEYAACIKDLISTPDYPHGCRIGFVSPSGYRIACLSVHTYGPQDIIILER